MRVLLLLFVAIGAAWAQDWTALQDKVIAGEARAAGRLGEQMFNSQPAAEPELLRAWMKLGIAAGDRKAAFYLGLAYLEEPVQKELARRYLVLALTPRPGANEFEPYARTVLEKNGLALPTPQEVRSREALEDARYLKETGFARTARTKADLYVVDADLEARKNSPKARELARAAIAEGSRTAGFWLGTWLVEGRGGEKDLAEAIRLLEKAPRDRRTWRFALAQALWDAEPPEQDRARALEIARDLSTVPWNRYEAPDLTQKLARFLAEHGSGDANAKKQAPATLLTKSEAAYVKRLLANPDAAGDPNYEDDPPQAEVAFRKALPLIEGRNWSAALPSLTEAAELGHVRAMYELSMVYGCSNCGVGLDPLKAEYWVQKAAATGEREARQRLGEFYRDTDPWIARKIFTEIGSTGSLAYLDNWNLGKGPRPATKAEREAALAGYRQKKAGLQASAMLASQSQPPAPAAAEAFPTGTQFQLKGGTYIALQVEARWGDTYTLLERKPRGKGTFDVSRVKKSAAELALYERVAAPKPFCTKCNGRGDSFLAKGTASGYDYVPDGNDKARRVYVGTYDGTYKPCTRCDGSGFESSR